MVKGSGRTMNSALEKPDGYIINVQTHKTAKQLGKSVTEYINMGFKVYHT